MAKFERPLVLGINQDTPRPDMALEERLSAYGNNTGNLLFAEALYQVVENARRSSYHFRKKDIEEADVVVVAAANWINAHSDFGNLTKRLKSFGKPVVIVGIGIQTDHGQPPTVTPGTRALLDLAAETSAMISVRGRMTEEVLRGWGYANVMATGCPSLLLSRGRFPDHAAAPRPRPTAANTVLMGTRHLFRPTASVQQDIYRFAYRQGVDMIMQSELADMYFIEDAPRDEVTKVKANVILAACYAEPRIDSIRKYLLSHGKVFFHTDPWTAYLQGKDYVIGTRIHGTITAILAGRRSILLNHDPRTAELAGIMGIPTAPLSHFGALSFDRLADLVDAADFDLTRRTFPAYRDRFAEFFALNGLALRQD